MKSKIIILALMMVACGWSLVFAAVKGPFKGYYYENIRWTKHTSQPTFGESDNKGQIDQGKSDVDGDGVEEDVKVTWGEGTTDHSLAIEINRADPAHSSLGALGPIAGSQPNYKFEDLDSDGKLEVIVWGGLWDYEVSGEGEQDAHRYVVTTYKLLSGGYALWDVYTTRVKYEPFFMRNEKGLPG